MPWLWHDVAGELRKAEMNKTENKILGIWVHSDKRDFEMEFNRDGTCRSILPARFNHPATKGRYTIEGDYINIIYVDDELPSSLPSRGGKMFFSGDTLTITGKLTSGPKKGKECVMYLARI